MKEEYINLEVKKTEYKRILKKLRVREKEVAKPIQDDIKFYTGLVEKIDKEQFELINQKLF